MKRRQLIKRLGLGAGYLVLGPSAFSLLKSCNNSVQPAWKPFFLSTSNGVVLEKILDIILPSTDTPGATDLNLAQFVDSYMGEVATEEQQDLFLKGAEDLRAVFHENYHKDIAEGTPEEYHGILTRFLKATPERSQQNVKRTTETQDPLDTDPEGKTNFSEGAFSYLNNVRELGIWGWQNSQVIGEEVLWYDPVPGVYIPCDTVENLGNGRAMSL